ncbi:hypothetical protein IC232_30670 [Microvirga sp. BT688]|uniref:hypothetical protein n=1 Tax=Microvirga sp. TaxID=1873136 RepID=UPI0016859D66|nr:hypothetical protein [Microvirga sp.]MBD2750999.1 hypothetical protein [Microvirga sp.]
MMLNWIDLLGYAASGLTLATFAQRSMLPMRILALGANGCFIAYGAMGVYLPVLLLHLVLLPVNLVRLRTLVAELNVGTDGARQEAVRETTMPGVSSGLL